MLKAADALADAGHRVRVVSLLSTPWAAEHDLELARQRAWVWCPVDIRPACARAAYLRSGLRRRAARHLARTFGPSALPDRIAATSLARAVPELIRSATATPADLVYAGTVGGLAVGPRAARRLGTPYALDLEDLYAGDCPPTPEGELDRALILRLERAVLGGAIFLTAGSASIAEAYADRFATRPIAIHNVLPRPDEKQPARAVGSGRRRLFWFSQTVGPDRGLEDVVDALGRLALGAELHLLGAARGPYVERLRARVDEVAPRVRLSVHPPVHPELL
ncbi:MAG: hypothetical protein KIT58_23555, partial [Planctomycetota bacterium]|nr:hypothetical protein [Planctomycetota bacterium]